MRRFAALLEDLEVDAGGADAQALLERYFAAAAAADAAWALHLLRGGRMPRPVAAARLRRWACAAAGIDDALFEACRAAAGGDAAEVIGHVLPPARAADPGLAEAIERWVLPLRGLPAAAQEARVLEAWRGIDGPGRILLVRLMGQGLRLRVDPVVLQQALAAARGLDAAGVAERLATWGDAWTGVAAARVDELLAPTDGSPLGRPYPMTVVEDWPAGPAPDPATDWRAEPDPAGLRVQVVRRASRAWIWSERGELLTGALPELHQRAVAWPDGCVLEGRWLAAERPGASAFVPLDLLELGSCDLRGLPLRERLARLVAWSAGARLGLAVPAALDPARGWEVLRAELGRTPARGLLLRRWHEPAPGPAWRWRAEPYRVLAVLIYVQRQEPPLLTLALWSRPQAEGGELLPVARVPAAADQASREAIARALRDEPLERFGPVRSLRARLVFELGYDGLRPSARRKSGLELIRPQVLAWRADATPQQVSTLAELLPGSAG